MARSRRTSSFSSTVGNQTVGPDQAKSSLAGAGLSGGNGQPLSVNIGTGLEFNGDAIQVADAVRRDVIHIPGSTNLVAATVNYFGQGSPTTAEALAQRRLSPGGFIEWVRGVAFLDIAAETFAGSVRIAGAGVHSQSFNGNVNAVDLDVGLNIQFADGALLSYSFVRSSGSNDAQLRGVEIGVRYVA